MKKLLLVSAILLPLGGCQSFWSTSPADFILDDVLGCDGDRTGATAWWCTVDYARDDKHDLMQDPNDQQEKPERNVEKQDKHGHHEHHGKRGKHGKGHHGKGHHGGHHGKNHGKNHGQGED